MLFFIINFILFLFRAKSIDYGTWFWPILDRFSPSINYANFWNNWYFGPFWAKIIDFSTWFWPILDRFSPPINYANFWNKLYFGPFSAKIIDYSTRFWPILTRFSPLINYVIFGINYILVLFEQKSWTIAHDFDRFWTVFYS